MAILGEDSKGPLDAEQGPREEQLEYIADMILALQGLAQRAGYYNLAAQLLNAYEAARVAGDTEEAKESAA